MGLHWQASKHAAVRNKICRRRNQREGRLRCWLLIWILRGVGLNLPQRTIVDVDQNLGFYSVFFTVCHGKTDFCAQAGPKSGYSDLVAN